MAQQNNFVGTSKIISDAAKNFDILAVSLRAFYVIVLSSTKLFFCIQLKFLDLLVKLFSPCSREKRKKRNGRDSHEIERFFSDS